MKTHAIERTSPKGEGQEFLGTCIMCGRKNLRGSAALEECDNPSGMPDAEVWRRVIDGPAAQSE